MAKKLTKGRQKVPIVKMEKKCNLQVTFTKRRNGLFKKASELCTLTGAEVALVVFSPGQKAYSFGHPSFESVIDKYLGENLSPANGSTDHQAVEARHAENIAELNRKFADLEKRLDAEKKRGEALDQMRNDGRRRHWWQAPLGQLSMDQLQRMDDGLEELKKKIENEQRKRQSHSMLLSRYLNPRNTFGGNMGPSNAMAVPFGAARASGPGPSNAMAVPFGGPRASGRNTFGRNVGPSNAMAVPFGGARASGPSGFSPFGAMGVDPAARAHGTGGLNMPHGTKPYVHKFF